MRLLFTFLIIFVTAAGGWWLWEHNAPFRNFVSEYIDNGEFLTLEAKFTPQQIMETHQKDLLKDEKHSFAEPSLKFHPYLLMEAKYTTPDRKSREGVLLWSMVDGEIVLNTDTWEKTHGFEDAIRANASRQDFKILNVLAKSQGIITKDQLQKELHLDPDVFEPWIDSAKSKHLIIQSGNTLQLHFENPKLITIPQTKINQWLVTKPYNHAQRVQSKYSQNQLEKIALAAFGSDFKLRNMTVVYLPVYGIDIINPDGSLLSTYWNALNGKRIFPKYLQM